MDFVQIVELAPLRRQDVHEVASARQIEADDFITAVMTANAVPLAIKPLTLDLLLRTYLSDGALPSRQTDLYRQGCRHLCEESEGRRELRLPRRLDADQRVAIAKRIAALTMFGNRAAIATGLDRGDMRDDDLHVAMLAGGTETGNGAKFLVSEQDVEETLNTGLFSSRGENRLGWAHQTYAEFLGAQYMIDHNLELPQIMSLLVHPGDHHEKLVPQLHETASWLAGMHPGFTRAIASREPEILLRSDANSMDGEDRSRITSSLLQACDAGEWVDVDWKVRKHFPKLLHPDLTSQLRPYIIDPAKGITVRRVAIHIAEACTVLPLLDDLVEVALDSEAAIETRTSAAYAVIGIGDSVHRAQLCSLVSIPIKDDPNLELRGCGLNATWPTHLSLDNLLSAIVVPETNLFGAYRGFLNNHPFSMASVNDLPQIFEWATTHADQLSVPYEIEPLIGDAIRRGWNHLDDQEVLKTFSKLVWTRLRHNDRIIDEDKVHLLEDEQRRRLVLVGVVSVANDDSASWIIQRSGLVQVSDAKWLLKQFQQRPDEERELWGMLLSAALPGVPSALDAVWTVAEQDDLLEQMMSPIFKPILLDSDEAVKQRERWQKHKEWNEREAPSTDDDSPYISTERIDDLLDRMESGEVDAWWWLNSEFMQESSSRYHNYDFESDLTALPGWKVALNDQRERILIAADRYLHDAPTDPQRWIIRDQQITIYRPDWAGLRAFRLLQTRAPAKVETLPSSVWKRWAPVIVGYHALNWGSDNTIWQQDLAARTYQQAAQEVRETLAQLIQAESQQQDPSIERLLWIVEKCWDEELATMVAEFVRQVTMSPISMQQLLKGLLAHRDEMAIRFAISLIPSPLPEEESDRERAAIAAALMLKNAPMLGWQHVWPAIQEDVEFAERVLSRLVWNEHRAAGIAAQLTEALLAEAYIWLCQQYPPEEDPQINGVIEYRAAIGLWRDGLLTELRTRGSLAACRQIERVRAALPGQEWLSATLYDARARMRQKTWIPPDPDDIKTLMQSSDRRLIQNTGQFVEVILESLQRLENEFQRAALPAAIDLWSVLNDGSYRPMDEERLSDRIARHLNNDLGHSAIVINREVVSRRGEETDIRVDALLRDEQGNDVDRSVVIIEVKGCWHPELWSAMKSQLVDRYLANSFTMHGLYLVGWFSCSKWDNDDPRWMRAPKIGMDSAAVRLNTQATELSGGGKEIRAFVIDTSLRH